MEIRTQTRVANKVSIDFSRRSGAGVAFGRVALGAIVLGVLVVGATAAGAVAIGTLFIRKGRIKAPRYRGAEGRKAARDGVRGRAGTTSKCTLNEVDGLFAGYLRPRLRAR
jgi:O-antigen/teichoic acid export membrane protein